jgi:hypothetical protein
VAVHSEHIGSTFGPKGFSIGSSRRLVVEIAQVVVHEGEEPNALAGLRHADVLTRG